MSAAPNRGRDDWVVSSAVVWWLLAAALSFLLGFLSLALFPGSSGTTWGTGIVTNVAMAVVVGGVLGWMRQWLQVLVAVIFGSIVTLLGLDALLLVPTPTENAHVGLLGLVLFDGAALLVAIIGMAILVGIGAVVGALVRTVLYRCNCLVTLRQVLLRLQTPHPPGELSEATR
jgi:predicted small integral membrane protein